MRNEKIYILFLIALLMSCQLQESPMNRMSDRSDAKQEQFDHFYKKFHSDSLFQISRIIFPLPGINSDAMTVDDTSYYWKKDEWLMHHTVDTVSFAKKVSISDTIVEEEITSRDPGFVVIRKFKNIEGKWYLVLYEDINL